ncbi:MAG: ATP-binding protein [Devosia sp.]
MSVGQTNWYVVTGGPSSGKTTTINGLRARGYQTTIEHARHYIDTQRVAGRSVEETRANQHEFQRGVIDMQRDEEANLDPSELVFLDRALPDGLAYYRFLGLEPDPDYLSVLRDRVYAGIFLLDLLPLAPDYARTEDSAAQIVIHSGLEAVYRELGYRPIAVPAVSPEARVDFILANLPNAILGELP